MHGLTVLTHKQFGSVVQARLFACHAVHFFDIVPLGQLFLCCVLVDNDACILSFLYFDDWIAVVNSYHFRLVGRSLSRSGGLSIVGKPNVLLVLDVLILVLFAGNTIEVDDSLIFANMFECRLNIVVQLS